MTISSSRLAPLPERRDVQVAVQDLDAGRRLDVAGHHVGRALGPQVRGGGLVDLGPDHEAASGSG